MRPVLLLLLMVVVLFPLAVRATIINIPDDYPTIQEGIDHSSDGDTVLVQPNTYYENLNFNAHNVVLASMFLTTGDTSYISGTIIDGSRADRVVSFENGEERTAKLVGFTIQNGYAPNGGAILCDHSSPTISNNIVKNSIAHLYYGGGIYCYSSSPAMNDNTITGNRAEYGGGIHCHFGDAQIYRNTVTYNSAGGTGGGIAIVEASPDITYNVVTDNLAGVNGGGLAFPFGGLPTVAHNQIHSNHAGEWGGGIYLRAGGTTEGNSIIANTADLGGAGIWCGYSAPTISNNVIAGNRTQGKGGGIWFYDRCSSALLTNNTIAYNSANGGYGGGISCGWSDPAFTNNILWADTAQNSPEIHVDHANPTVTYCDVQGGWPGLGNIDADPLFVDPPNGDFNLQSDSPCIDAGDPELADPDHSRSDMGALPYHFEVTVRINPDDPFPLVFQPGYDAWGVRTIANNTDIVQAFRMVTAVTDTLGRVLQFLQWSGGELAPASLREAYGYLHVADDAPDGFYFYVVRATNPQSGELWHMSVTPFEVSGEKVTLAPNTGWSEHFEGQPAPSEFPFTSSPGSTFGSRCYPNPFNASTTISYQLPSNAYVRLHIYNLRGGKVVTLLDEMQEAGYRSITWDASKLSSGVYFYRLTAGDFSETKRMVLVK